MRGIMTTDRRRRLCGLAVLFLAALTCNTQLVIGADSLIVESKEVDLYAGTDTLHVRIVNRLLTRAIVIPFVVRDVDPGCLPSAMSVGFAERLESKLTQISVTNQYARRDGLCAPESLLSFATPHSIEPHTLVPVDSAQWGLLLAAYGYPESEYLPAGADSAGSIVIAFTPPPVFGSFEIDTTCVAPANHVFFMDGYAGTPVIRTPVFVKGAVRLCDCRYHGDLDGSGGINATDMAILIDWVFFGVGPPPTDPTCPHSNRGDFNCDGIENATDLTLLINHVNFGGPGPCDPCACDPYPTNCP